VFSGAQSGFKGKLVRIQRGPATVTRNAVSQYHSTSCWGR
jgi:hypothetical protein